MRTLFGVSVIALFLSLVACGAAAAADCGECADAGCGKSCCQEKCACPCERYCIVMKTCKEIVYDYEEVTFYKTVYEEVVDKNVIDTVKYVEETKFDCVPSTAWQPEMPTACTPPDCCDSTCCQPEEKPTCYLRRVPVKTFRAVPVQKTVKTPRVVTKQVPYTVVRCIPRCVYKQVPVKVCCPEKPCCCKKTCGKQKCCHETGCAE